MKNLDSYIIEKFLISKNTKVYDDIEYECFGYPHYICDSFNNIKKIDNYYFTDKVIDFLKKAEITFPCRIYNLQKVDRKILNKFSENVIKYRKHYNIDVSKIDMNSNCYYSDDNTYILIVKLHDYLEIWFYDNKLNNTLYLLLPENQKGEN